MKYNAAVLSALAGSAVAYPGMMLPREPVAEAEPQILSTILGDLSSTVSGLLNSVAASVDPSNLRPEPGYTFTAPGPGDSRGPCPGLNLLANYGYLPHNGYVNAGQVVDAVARGFNMGADLATVLVVFAVLTDGDIATESWYLGSGPNGVGGLNRHSTVEADISPKFGSPESVEDYYNGCGDNHHISSRLFKQNCELALLDPSKQFNFNVMGKHYGLQSKFAQKYNPNLYYFPFPMIVSVVAYNFYSAFFSNGTYGAGGVANYKSISNIIGAKYNAKHNAFEYVPERWPANWYRRSYPYGAVQALTEGFTYIYPNNPVTPGVAQFGTSNLNATTLVCDIYMGINSITPLGLAGGEEAAAAATTWALAKLDPFFGNTVLGCPKSTISNDFLYPNATRPGGPLSPSNLSPPASYIANSGNNVYNKIYFTATPSAPLCQHTTTP